MKRALFLAPFLFFIINAIAEDGKKDPIITKEVEYQAGRVKAIGYLALPTQIEKPVPGILIVHEKWGNNDYTRTRAKQLAELGYGVLALDMYGEGAVADTLRKASLFSQLATGSQREIKARFTAGMKLLQAQEEIDGAKIAAIGYGFGGNIAIQMARNGTRGLLGVASFYSSLDFEEPNRPTRVQAKILVCHGGEDVFTRKDKVEEFKNKMTELQADLKFVIYPESMEGFANPKSTELGEKFRLPLVYNAKADTESWAELQLFLTALFRD